MWALMVQRRNFFLSKIQTSTEIYSSVVPLRSRMKLKRSPFLLPESPLELSSSNFPVTFTDDQTIVSSIPIDLSFPCQALSPCSSLKLIGDSSNVCNQKVFLPAGKINPAPILFNGNYFRNRAMIWKLRATARYPFCLPKAEIIC